MVRKITVITVITVLMVSLNAMAQASCEKQVVIHTKGMVCDFCAQALEKLLPRKLDVESIAVDLSEATVTIVMDVPQAVEDSIFSVLIEDSGYTVERIERGC